MLRSHGISGNNPVGPSPLRLPAVMPLCSYSSAASLTVSPTTLILLSAMGTVIKWMFQACFHLSPLSWMFLCLKCSSSCLTISSIPLSLNTNVIFSMRLPLTLYFILLFYYYYYIFCFLGLYMQHMEVLRPGVKLELQLLRQSQSNLGSKTCLWPTPQLTATSDPEPTEQGQGSKLSDKKESISEKGTNPHGY